MKKKKKTPENEYQDATLTCRFPPDYEPVAHLIVSCDVTGKVHIQAPVTQPQVLLHLLGEAVRECNRAIGAQMNQQKTEEAVSPTPRSE